MKKFLFLLIALLIGGGNAWAQGTVVGSRSLQYSPALDGEGNFQNGTRFYTIECARQNGKFFGSAIPVIRNKKSQATTDDAKWAIMPTATEGQYQLMNKQSKKVLTFASTGSNAVSSMTENLSDANSIMEFVTTNNSRFAAGYECFKIVGAEAYPNDMDAGLKVWTSSQALWGWGNSESNPGNGDDGSKWKFTEVEVINNVAVESVTLNVTSVNLNIGQLQVLTATVAPAEATQAVTIVSDNEAVARVVDGKIQAISEGTATITVTSEKDPTKTATCEVTVTKQDWYIHVSPEMGIHPDGGRVVSTITLNGTDIAVPSYSYPYVDLTTQKFTVEAGASVQVGMTNIGWMHSMFYVDTDEDRQFTEGEMVTHSTLTGGSGTNSGIAAFTAPAAGTYRMRFKTDWHGNNANGNDPAGRIGDDGTLTGNNSIWANRGVIIDVMLEVTSPTTKANVTYKYVVDGKEVKTIANEQTIGGNVAAQPLTINANYATVSDDREGKTVAADGSTVVTVTVTQNLPFEAYNGDGLPKFGLLNVHSNQARILYSEGGKLWDTTGETYRGDFNESGRIYNWCIEGNVVEGFKLSNGMHYVNVTAGNQATLSEEATIFDLRPTTSGVGGRNFKKGFCLAIAGSNNFLNAQTTGQGEARTTGVKTWTSADAGSTFEFETTYDFTISDAGQGYATLFYHSPLQLPEGVAAYSVVREGDVLVPTELADRFVPSATPVVLYGTPGNHTATVTTAYGNAAIADNALSGRYVNGTDGINDNTYVFSIANDTPGFYKFGGTTLAEFKAYYQAPTSAVNGFVLDFGGQTVGIEGLQTVAPVKGAFDLQGRRVNAATRGLFIQNGVKVIR